jgi:arginase family enzyme
VKCHFSCPSQCLTHASHEDIIAREIQRVFSASATPRKKCRHTYLTLDLDALDPSEMPAVGTPEPGGLRWYQVLDLLRELCRRTTVVGMDVVELCPLEGQTRADFLAAKLVYKMIGYRFCATL